MPAPPKPTHPRHSFASPVPSGMLHASHISPRTGKFVMRFLTPLGALAAAAQAAAQPPVAPPPNPLAPFPAMSDSDAWSKLPRQKNPQLPEWARVLAGTHPQ